MKDYLVYKTYTGKNLLSQDVEIPVGTYVDRVGDLVYFEGIPFCTWRSYVAKNYLIWNGDDQAETRLLYENIIIFGERVRIWSTEVPVYNESGKEIGKKLVRVTGRFSPNEISYMKKMFPQLLKEEDVFNFNDYFYTGSSIKEIEALANYLGH